MRSAYLLVSHGSRDSRPQVAMERLAWLVSRPRELFLQGNRTQGVESRGAEEWGSGGAIPNPKSQIPNSLVPLVGTAYLELSPTPLHQQIAEFSDRALSCGYQQVQVVPMFLLPGVHVMEDIPAEVELARQVLQAKAKLELRPHLGSHAGLVRLLQKQLDRTQAEKIILLAHGSRRKGAGHPVEAIAQQIGAVAAYWSVSPSLAERVQELAIAGWQRIAIVPYFLFAGGITDAIAEVVGQLQQQFPAIEFCLMEPLGATQELADLIRDLIEV